MSPSAGSRARLQHGDYIHEVQQTQHASRPVPILSSVSTSDDADSTRAAHSLQSWGLQWRYNDALSLPAWPVRDYRRFDTQERV